METVFDLNQKNVIGKNTRQLLLQLQNTLKKEKGVDLIIESATDKEVHITMKNLNGNNVSKYQLFNIAYAYLHHRLPENCRLLIQV